MDRRCSIYGRFGFTGWSTTTPAPDTTPGCRRYRTVPAPAVVYEHATRHRATTPLHCFADAYRYPTTTRIHRTLYRYCRTAAGKHNLRTRLAVYRPVPVYAAWTACRTFTLTGRHVSAAATMYCRTGLGLQQWRYRRSHAPTRTAPFGT